MQHDLTQVSASFPTDLFKRGSQLAYDHAVFDLNSRNQGIVITARVKENPTDPESEIHRVFVNVVPNLKPPFEGECSCDLGDNCEHVVATLIAAIESDLIGTAPNPAKSPQDSADKQTSSPMPTSNTPTNERIKNDEQGKGQWLNNIRSKQRTSHRKPSLGVFYDLRLSTQFGQIKLWLKIFAAVPHRTENYNQKILTDNKQLNIGRYTLDKPARYMAPVDTRIFAWLLERWIHKELPNPMDITGLAEAELLQLLSQTQRCRLSANGYGNQREVANNKDSSTNSELENNTPWSANPNLKPEESLSPINSGANRHLQPLWHINHRGEQWLNLSRPKQSIVTLGAKQPFYIDWQHHEWGAIDNDFDYRVLQAMNQGITLKPGEVRSLMSAINLNGETTETTQKIEKPPQSPPWHDILATSLALHQLPLPLESKTIELENLNPHPILQLYSKRISKIVDRSYRRPAFVDGAAIYFSYTLSEITGDQPPIQEQHKPSQPTEAPVIQFHFKDEQTSKTIFHHGALYTVNRNLASEEDAIDKLQQIASGLIPLNQLHDADWTDESQVSGNLSLPRQQDDGADKITLDQNDFGFLNESEWEDFLLTSVKELKQHNWSVNIAPQFRHHYANADTWYGDIQQTNTKWFDLEMGIMIDGEKVNLLPILVHHIQQGNTLLSIPYLNQQADNDLLNLPLPDGRIIPLPVSRIRRILSVFVELYDTTSVSDEGKIRIASTQSTRLGELDFDDDEIVDWQGEKSLFESAQKLREFTHIEEIEPPYGFNATLRDYQKTGLDWLHFLNQYDLGGILADDMGLGKTIQALAYILYEQQSGRLDLPAMVIAPTSVITNWRREAKQFAPSLKVKVFHGPKRHQLIPKLHQQDIIITSYALIHRDLEIWQERELSHVILDEAHHIKNRKAKVSSAIRKLNAKHRLCLTGTPMENHLGEMWSIFDFLMPKFLGNEKEFRTYYRNPIEKEGDAARAEALSRRVAPFLLRRTKAQVATELPPKTEIIKTIPFNEDQQDLYESIRLSMDEKVRSAIKDKGVDKSQIVILDALLKLRQICCDPALLKIEQEQAIESAKLEALMEMLPQMIEEGRRILLFSQFTSMLEIIEKRVKKLKIKYVKLTGATRNRDLVIDKFQSGETPLFLLSLKAGGVGLNLTAADSVIHYDPWWNPAAENQATDRAYRIGQDKPVFVYKLLVENSIEEAIFQMQKEKLTLVESMYQNQNNENQEGNNTDEDANEEDNGLNFDKPFNLTGEDLAALLQST